MLRITDTLCTKDKTAPHSKVSDVLQVPDLVNNFAEGPNVGGAERLSLIIPNGLNEFCCCL